MKTLVLNKFTIFFIEISLFLIGLVVIYDILLIIGRLKENYRKNFDVIDKQVIILIVIDIILFIIFVVIALYIKNYIY